MRSSGRTRKELRVFLTELQITAVYVTHDRVEALALSDMIGVMNKRKIVELGTPRKIYFDADHRFVADSSQVKPDSAKLSARRSVHDRGDSDR